MLGRAGPVAVVAALDALKQQVPQPPCVLGQPRVALGPAQFVAYQRLLLVYGDEPRAQLVQAHRVLGGLLLKPGTLPVQAF